MSRPRGRPGAAWWTGRSRTRRSKSTTTSRSSGGTRSPRTTAAGGWLRGDIVEVGGNLNGNSSLTEHWRRYGQALRDGVTYPLMMIGKVHDCELGQNDIYYITGENIIQHSALQLKKFDGKKMKDSLDIEDEDEKKKPEELKAKLEPLTKLMKEVLGDMERITKTQAMRDYSMILKTVPKKTMKINPKHSIMSELKKKTAVNKSDNNVKNMIQLLITNPNLEEP
eukprot:11656290-Heterocapsa_arctica.AAC.1